MHLVPHITRGKQVIYLTEDEARRRKLNSLKHQSWQRSKRELALQLEEARAQAKQATATARALKWALEIQSPNSRILAEYAVYKEQEAKYYRYKGMPWFIRIFMDKVHRPNWKEKFNVINMR